MNKAFYSKYFNMIAGNVDGIEKKTYSYKKKAFGRMSGDAVQVCLTIVSDQVDLSIHDVLEIHRLKSVKMLFDNMMAPVRMVALSDCPATLGIGCGILLASMDGCLDVISGYLKPIDNLSA